MKDKINNINFVSLFNLDNESSYPKQTLQNLVECFNYDYLSSMTINSQDKKYFLTPNNNFLCWLLKSILSSQVYSLHEKNIEFALKTLSYILQKGKEVLTEEEFKSFLNQKFRVGFFKKVSIVDYIFSVFFKEKITQINREIASRKLNLGTGYVGGVGSSNSNFSLSENLLNIQIGFEEFEKVTIKCLDILINFGFVINNEDVDKIFVFANNSKSFLILDWIYNQNKSKFDTDEKKKMFKVLLSQIEFKFLTEVSKTIINKLSFELLGFENDINKPVKVVYKNKKVVI